MNESLYNWMPPDLVTAICWTLIHSLWLGVLLAVVTGVMVACTRRSRPLVRYQLFVLVVCLFALSVGFLFIREYRNAGPPAAALSITQQESVTAMVPPASGTAIEARSSTLQPVMDYFNGQAGWIVLVWVVLFGYHLVRLFAGLHYIHRIRTVHTVPLPAQWRARAHALGRTIGIRQPIMFLQSAIVKVPVVVGMLRPVILLPIGLVTNTNPRYVEAILLHELAHIRRKDFIVNLLQTFLESIFFFNPALLWISSLVREEREACCDDIVLRHTADKRDYLQALLMFQEQDPTFAMALQTRKAYLLNRVKRMLTNENKKLNIMEKIILISGLLFFSAFALLPAQERKLVPPPVPEQPASPPAPGTPVVAVTPVKGATPVVVPVHTPAKIKTVIPVTPSEPPQPPVPVKDTVPGTKIRVTHMSTDMHDDGKTRTSAHTLTTADGKTYHVKKVNTETVLLAVDGKNIPKAEIGQYSDILEYLDNRERHAKEKRAHQEMKRKHETQLRHQKVKMEQHHRAQERKEMMRRNQDERKAMLNKQKELHQLRAEKQQIKRTQVHAKLTNAKTGNEVSGIIEELARENLITSPDDLSFTLTEKELLVNGSRQDAALQQRLKEKYGLKTGDSVQYKKTGGSTTTTIVRN